MKSTVVKRNRTVTCNWSFIIQDPSNDDISKLNDLPCVYMVYAYRLDEGPRPVIDGYIVFNRSHRRTGVKRMMPKASWDSAYVPSYVVADYLRSVGTGEGNYFFQKGVEPRQRQPTTVFTVEKYRALMRDKDEI